MRRQSFVLAVLFLPVMLTGCGGAGGVPVNLRAVLDRTAATLEKFDAYLRRYDYKSVDRAMLDQFNNTIEHELNAKPRIHSTAIATRMNKDASISGFGDINRNGEVDGQEPKLFSIEFDPDNNRIILTSASGDAIGRSYPRGGGGFFSGVMIGALMNRQRDAGIKPGHFNRRSVAGAPAGQKVAKNAKPRRGSQARGRARSGGVRGGK